MSDARKMQVCFEELAAGFLHPLLSGGEVRVGRPLAPGMLSHFALARPSDMMVDQEIYRRVHDDASELAPLRALPWPDRGVMALTMAAYDMLAVTDPSLERWLGRRARKTIMSWVDFFLAQAGAPRTRGEALARHAVLARILELKRQDVVAENWGFTHKYLGRPVPQGFFTRPRWVEERRSQPSPISLWESLDPELETRRRLRTLLSRSPVTELLRTDLFPDLVFGTASLAVLSDDLVRSGIARAMVAEGPAVAAPFGHALRMLAAQSPPPRLLFYPLALIYEAHVIAALDAHASKEAIFGSADSPDAALFLAILPAIMGAPDDLGALLDLDPDDLALLRRHAGRLDGAVGAEASSLAVALIDQAEPPRLEHERDAEPPHEVATR